MLKNYLKITVAVLLRRKFYTIISLFGISVTLLVMIVLAGFLDYFFAANYPDVNRDRSMYISYLVMRSSKTPGIFSGSDLSLYFIQKYVMKLQTPEKIAIVSRPELLTFYFKNKKTKTAIKTTDGNFWEVTKFDFLEGKPYTQQSIENNESVIVINDNMRDEYFGKGVSCVGKKIEIRGAMYRVEGVVRGCPTTSFDVAADIYKPYQKEKKGLEGDGLWGTFTVIIVAKNKEDLPKIVTEWADIIARVKPPKGDETHDIIEASIDPFFNYFMSNYGPMFVDHKGQRTIFYSALVIFFVLFMSLPAINLVNINLNRMMDRCSEIGVRKAFGASSKSLVGQFVLENIFLTILGGFIAIILAMLFFHYFNQSNIVPYSDMHINWTVALIAFSLSFFFGLVSGVFPAWKTSKLQIVEALK